MSDSWDDVVEAYLDGELDAAESLGFERALARPEVSGALARALMLRELLRTAPPEVPPEGLVERIEAEIGSELEAEVLEVDDGPRPKKARRKPRLARLRAVLGGAAWSVRGPAVALANSGIGQPSAAQTLRYALAPLTVRGRRTEASSRKPVRLGGWLMKLWRRR